MLNEQDIAKKIIKTLDLNKAKDIKLYDVTGKCSFANYIIIATGNNIRHVSSLAKIVDKELINSGENNAKINGKENSDWVLIDAFNIVIHIFRDEVREFYQLDQIWEQ